MSLVTCRMLQYGICTVFVYGEVGYMFRPHECLGKQNWLLMEVIAVCECTALCVLLRRVDVRNL